MSATQHSYRRRLHRVMTYIQDNLDGALDLETLARVADFSPFHFHRIFQGMTGEPLAAHIRRLRLARAAWRLESSDMSVVQTALEAGYETPEAFCRAFKLQHAEAPTLFRQRSRHRRRQRLWRLFPPSEIEGHPKQGATPVEVVVTRKPSYRVAYVRAIGPYGQSATEAWARLCAWAGPRGLLTPQTLYIGVSQDDPFTVPAEKLRYDACITVGPTVEADAEVGVSEIPGGDFATVLHKGPYEQLEKTYTWICGAWLPASGREAAMRPSYEVYFNSPQDTAPEALLTEINMPLAEAHR